MPRGKKGKLGAALRQAQQVKAKHDAARRVQEHMESKLVSGGKSAKSKGKRKQSRAPFFPYKADDSILLIGEGNFSFAHSIARRLSSGINIVATAYDSRQVVSQKYAGDVEQNIAQFEALGGTVLFGVDGTDLKSCGELKGRKFTHVVFNFPHAGAGIKDQARNIQTNQLLLIGFFRSAASFLTVGSEDAKTKRGRAQKTRSYASDRKKQGSDNDDDDDDDNDGDVTVANGSKQRAGGDAEDSEDESEVFEFEGAKARVTYEASAGDDDDFSDSAHKYALDSDSAESDAEKSEFKPNTNRAGQIHVSLKSGLPYAHWNIRQLARECGLRGHATYPFELQAFPGYEHRRTLGFKEGLSKDENQEIRDKEPKIYVFVAKPADEDEGEEYQGSASTGDGRINRGRRAPKQPQKKRSLGVTSESFDDAHFGGKRRRR
ncbi:hypothetical protein GQ54DRAFT_299627 [Martensiomyces pterosporus]|nr:hypothetical protein GQ54DRAFT_299627 [Martensiomyces pterosporus]